MSVLTIIKANGEAVSLSHDSLRITVDVYDLDGEGGSGRNQKGELFRDRVAVKRKINCEWGYLSAQDMAQILSAVEDEFFTVIYPDPKTGTGRSMSAYTGDRSAPMYICAQTVEDGQSLAGWWSGLSLSIIEK